MQQGPRSPQSHEFNQVVDFLNTQLRENHQWPIASEYPTALSANNIHNMSIITEDEKIVSHAVLKTLIIKTPIAIFKVGAIGSVVTDPVHRQKGLSRKNIAHCLQLAEEQDCDFVILWTDQFDFYRKFGFELAGYELSYVLENASVNHKKLNTITPTTNDSLKFMASNQVSPEALLKLYAQHTVQPLRTIDDFRQFLKIPNSNLYTAWNSTNQLVAYAVEGKGIDLINYVHEWAGKSEALVELFWFIQNQKQQPLTIMTPYHSFNLRQHLAIQTQFEHKGFLGMIKLIKTEQVLTKVKKAFRAEGVEHIVFEKQNSHYIFGIGSDLYTLENESDLVQLLFGPLEIKNLSFVSENTRQIMAQLLPLPLWIWGWDSI